MSTRDVQRGKDAVESLDSAPFGKERKCTDCLCLILFGVFWAGMVGCLGLGMQDGDPRRLVYGYETNGDDVIQCGGKDKEDEMYTLYPRVEEDLLMQASKLTTPWDISFFGVCAETCPQTNDYVCNTDGDDAVAMAMAAAGPTATLASIIDPCLNTFQIPCFGQGGSCCADSAIAKGCFKTLFDTSPIFYRCMPEYKYDESLVSQTCVEYALVSDLPANGKCKKRNFLDAVCRDDSAAGWSTDFASCNATAAGYETACGKCMKLTTVVQVEETKPEDSSLLYDSFNSGAREFDRYMGDLEKSYGIVLACGLGVGFLNGLSFIISMYLAAGLMVWTSLAFAVISLVLFTLFCFMKAGILDDAAISQVAGVVGDVSGLDTFSNSTVNSSSLPAYLLQDNAYQQEFTYAAYTMTVVTVIFLLLVIFLLGRIARAVAMLKIASKALRKYPALTLLPFASALIVFANFIFWFGTSAYIASSGELAVSVPGTDYALNSSTSVVEVAGFEPMDGKGVVLAFLFLGLLWTNQFIHAFLVVSVSGTVGTFYWLDEDHPRAKRPVLSSLWVAFRYHLGTIAFGSLLVAVVQFIRYITMYLDARTKKMQKENRVMKFIFMILHCCLRCLERCIKFITNNAFVVTGLYGKNFCMSTKAAFGLIMANMAQVATLNFLSDIIVKLGQVGIAASAALLAWLIFENDEAYGRDGDKELDAQWFPVLCTAILAWPVGKAVLSIYSIAIDTILVSYCQDNNLGRKAGHSTRTSPELEAFVKQEQGARDPASRRLSATAQEVQMVGNSSTGASLSGTEKSI